MPWETVYDFKSESFNWGLVGLVTFLIIMGYALAGAGACGKGPRRKQWILTGLLGGTFFLLIGVIVIPYNAHLYYSTRNVYDTQEYDVVEGVVEQFVPMPYGGHMNESFTVQNVKFEYSDYDESYYGFNNTKSHGGPIDKGKMVRIAYVIQDGKNVILRLEVQE